MTINKTKRPDITKSARPKTQIIDVRDEYNQIKSFPVTGELPLTIYIFMILFNFCHFFEKCKKK